ncbi:T9SS type B sorting domain-containing protein [Flavobacterium eburneipallidum]|uniref:T9SS type B sorting domain-containing protein n=1 Tax=Flavobacterium eburneipallidum TaxID=3003263 RepID=UPI002482DD1D|nr:choice-of-anchor L domain-containing protein [Flavobacterium eburneipallidum]
MKWILNTCYFFLICCNTNLLFAQNITVNDSYTAQQLVENVLVNSPCALVSNFNVNGDAFPVGQNSYGFFTNGGGSFPFKEGIVLSTWSAKNSIGPYAFYRGDGNDTAWAGDTDLEQAIRIASTNATFLEFDFTPLTNFLSFDYIFASNEYNGSSPCQYSDGFAFLIKEKGSVDEYQNLAVIPGTTTPVSSTNIHGNTNNCSAVNGNYYNGNNTATSPINYAGQTVVMNAQTSVVPGKTYRIKLVIADDKNEYYDSAVFLQAGSFAPKIDLGPDRTRNNPVCFGESLVIDTKLSASYSYKWFRNNTEIIGATSPSYTVTDTGAYSVEVLFSPSSCSAVGKINIEFAPEILLSDTTITQCDDNNDGITIFDLTKVDNSIKNNNTSLSDVVYFESLSNARANTSPILNPTSYTNKPAIPTLFARVTNSFNCANYANVNLVVANNTIAPQNPISTCDEDAIQDGLYQFDLNTQVTPQVLTGLPAGMQVEYYRNTNDAVAQKNPLPNLFKNTIPNLQIIYARIINGADCYGIIPITVVVNTFNPTNFQEETAFLCANSSVDLTVATGYSSYVWNTGETSNSITVTTAGKYSVAVTNANNCKAIKNFTVTDSEIATITGAKVNDFAGIQNSILIEYTGVGDYEFSLDNIYYQDSPLFTGMAPGNYLAYAQDKNGCGTSNPFAIYVLDYPRFFTPNADGSNDNWKIKNLDLFPNAVTTIFNRYGKLIAQLNANSLGWNGYFNNAALPADDYWFTLHFGNGKIVKGHFSLKR